MVRARFGQRRVNFSLTLTLSPRGEGMVRVGFGERSANVPARLGGLPLPLGEGWGEGKTADN
ncbi:hypothetical protein BIY27_22175 [Gibbsiella quercinecans]|nr:hypothetical protein BIY27_22175 [Gibbsiella quercinecans]